MEKVVFRTVLGNGLKLDGGSMFGNAPKALWSSWEEPDEKNRIELAGRCLLVQTESGKNILIESGCGAFFEPKMKERYGIDERHLLLENLPVDPAAIDAVLLTHLHFDHAGGVISAYGDKNHVVFPNATIYVSKEHFEYAKNPHPRERASFIPKIQETLEASGQLELFSKEEGLDLGFDLQLFYGEGHTRSMVIPKIGNLLFASDLVPGLSWIHLPIYMGFDRFAEKKVDEKKALFEEGLQLFFTHDKKWSCATLNQDTHGHFVGSQLLETL